MQIIWDEPVPVSKTQVANIAEPERGWKPQTVYTLLNRLVEKGFLSTEKVGKERFYTPLVSEETYLSRDTGRFMDVFHKNSVTGLMNALFSESITESDLTELKEWMEGKT
jgi:predicted transcriptional regulator